MRAKPIGQKMRPFEPPFLSSLISLCDPWERPGSTTFYFTNGTIQDTLEKARQAAQDKDVRISGGANIIQQYLNAGLVDEFILHLAPTILGSGVRLFEGIEKRKFKIEALGAMHSPLVTHLKYRVVK